jgi:uncharacterized protein YjbI with pentapeptide repeats
MKIEIKCRFSGHVLFTHECEENTIKNTLKAAIDSRAYLCGADLSGAYLCGADLSGAYLYGAYLCGADLSGAYLCGADLSGAYLCGADLYGADLAGADLSGAYLSGAYLYGKENTIKEIKQIGTIGSRGGFTIAFKCQKSIEINCGCFWGNIEEFTKQVKEKHSGTKHETEYMAMMSFIKKIWPNK